MSAAAKNGVHQRLARAVVRRAEHSAQRHQATYLADVVHLDPLRVELHTQADVLEVGQGLHLTQWMQFYNTVWGIKLDDTAVLDFRNGHFVWHDLLSDTVCTPLSGGL